MIMMTEALNLDVTSMVGTVPPEVCALCEDNGDLWELWVDCCCVTCDCCVTDWPLGTTC